MADIRNYMKEKEKREQNQLHYKERIHKHRLTFFYRILLICIAIGALILLVFVQYNRHIYTAYETLSSIKRENISGTTDVRLGNSILTYSKDGAHCTDLKGNVIWNQTYEIQDIIVHTCENVAAIANRNGRNAYIVSDEKLITEINTNLPIRDIAVSSAGTATVVMADADATWLCTYTNEGKESYRGEVSMKNSGYPTSISLSPSGDLVMVSFAYFDTGALQTNIAFYNLTEIGENYHDTIVRADIYSGAFVPKVQFLNNNTSFAISDSSLMIYKGTQMPTLSDRYEFSSEVRSLYYSDRYIGVVFDSDKIESNYKMEVYDLNAEKIGTYYFDINYTDIFFTKDTFVIHNETECVVMKFDGIEKYNGAFSQTVRSMIPYGTSYKYAIVTNDSIDTIQLK